MSMRLIEIRYMNLDVLGLKITDDELEDLLMDLDFTLFDSMTIDSIAVTWTDIDSTRIYMCGDELLFHETILYI